jgi:hypothetical protein
MTEAEWLAATDPQPMLKFLEGRTSDRKLRLFAVACLRIRWSPNIDDDRPTVNEGCSGTLREVERYLEGEATLEGLRGCFDFRDFDSDEVGWHLLASRPPFKASTAAALASQAASAGATRETTYNGVMKVRGFVGLKQCALLRCIFGYPGSPGPPLDPVWITWNDGTVRTLAESVYKERAIPEGALDAARLGVLADALEDAGCTDAELLGHLRGQGPHVRGCWALDHVLAKK